MFEHFVVLYEGLVELTVVVVSPRLEMVAVLHVVQHSVAVPAYLGLKNVYGLGLRTVMVSRQGHGRAFYLVLVVVVRVFCLVVFGMFLVWLLLLRLAWLFKFLRS